MKFAGKVFFALLTLVFVCGAEAAVEWVQIYRPDVPSPEWVKINTEQRSGQILHINGSSLVVDIGISRGARKGGLFLVYSGKSRAAKALAVLRIAQTAGDFSICEMTPYVAGGEVRVGDLVTPASISAEKDTVYCDPPVTYREHITEGFVSTPQVYGVPANVAAAVSAPVITGVPALVPTAGAYAPVAAPVPGPVPPAPAPMPPYDYAPPAPQAYAVPQAVPAPQAYPAPQTPAVPYAQESPYPNNVTYPPYPNYQNTSA
ncbi:MAG: hypothetical protein LBL05_04450, partial [Synergistaceae bacterium]|nr:hypothetical protein [Synergistaceae bacterium]